MTAKRKAAAPPLRAVEAMREHREREHGRPFDLERHVSYPGHSRSRAPMTYRPPTPARGARFHCRLCPGLVFPLTAVDYSEPEAQALWLRQHPGEARAVRRRPPGERAGAIKAFESGSVTSAALDAALRKRSMRRARSPRDAARRRGAQRWLLERRAQGYTVEAAIEALVELQASDPEAWLKVSGGTRRVEASTLEDYWGLIPIEEREAARARRAR